MRIRQATLQNRNHFLLIRSDVFDQGAIILLEPDHDRRRIPVVIVLRRGRMTTRLSLSWPNMPLARLRSGAKVFSQTADKYRRCFCKAHLANQGTP
jgi:hypothetical protein